MGRIGNVAWDSGTINESRTVGRRTLLVVGTAVLLSTAAVVADEVITSPAASLPSVPWMLVVFSAAFTITSAFAVWTARSLGLPSFLLLSPLSSRRRWLRFAVYGVGVGVFISLTSGALHLTTRATPFGPSIVYAIDGHLKVLTLSARAALAEETMYRLFAIPFLVSLAMRFYGWRPRFGFEPGPLAPPDAVRPPRRLVLAALVISALFFGLAHATNPLAATAFGLLLGFSYLRGGWESAVTAHFLGDYLLFAGLFL